MIFLAVNVSTGLIYFHIGIAIYFLIGRFMGMSNIKHCHDLIDKYNNDEEMTDSEIQSYEMIKRNVQAIGQDRYEKVVYLMFTLFWIPTFIQAVMEACKNQKK